jgi:hypothetical protein
VQSSCLQRIAPPISLSHFVRLGGPPRGRGAGHLMQVAASLSGQNPAWRCKRQFGVQSSGQACAHAPQAHSSAFPHRLHQWPDLVRSYEHIHRNLGDGYATVGAWCDDDQLGAWPGAGDAGALRRRDLVVSSRLPAFPSWLRSQARHPFVTYLAWRHVESITGTS